MPNFSIVIPIYNQYELLRQCIESIWINIPHDSYHEIIIVDDYSDPNGKLREYENFLSTLPKFKIIKSDEYRRSIHCRQRHIEVARARKERELEKMEIIQHSRGHGNAYQTGIDQVQTDFVFCCDADCIFLTHSKNIFNDFGYIFKAYPNAAAIGQLAGVMSNDVLEYKEHFKYTFGGIENHSGSCLGSPAFACRINCFSEKNISISKLPQDRGWALSEYCKEIYQQGLSIINYPIFSKNNLFHVGGGSLFAARFGGEAGIENIKYGMLEDGNPYGGRRGSNLICDWYQGRYLLRMKTKEYINSLRDKYNTSFDKIQSPLNEELLYLVDEERPKLL